MLLRIMTLTTYVQIKAIVDASSKQEFYQHIFIIYLLFAITFYCIIKIFADIQSAICCSSYIFIYQYLNKII